MPWASDRPLVCVGSPSNALLILPPQEERNRTRRPHTAGPRDRYPRATLIEKDGLLTPMGAGKSLKDM